MKLEINRAFKRRQASEKKKQEKIDLAPVQALQPKSRSIRYDNMKSAMAEETVIAQILREPALQANAKNLLPEHFSSSLLGRVYGQLCSRASQGLEVSVAVLADLEGEEMSHITGIVQRHQDPINEQAFADCVRTILSEHQAAGVATEDDLLAYQNKLKERKGIKI